MQNPTVVSSTTDGDKLLRQSPFVVGRPLRADEPLFGRDEAFRFIASRLANADSVNIIGERRMGKTSLLNHLLAPEHGYLPATARNLRLLPVRLNLQAEITDARRFYGASLREMLAQTAKERGAGGREHKDLLRRLQAKPEIDYPEFENRLRQLQEQLRIYPLLIVDEFELMIEAREGFAYPTFFNGLRALIEKPLLLMVIASRAPLVFYFTDPSRSDSLTSTFPNYFQPFTLQPLDETAADDLLLQKSDYPLSVDDAHDAKQWSARHPCLLQAAGESFFLMRAERRRQAEQRDQTPAEPYNLEWAHRQREVFKSQNCLVTQNRAVKPKLTVRASLRRLLPWLPLLLLVGVLIYHFGLQAVLVNAPGRVGEIFKAIGEWLDKFFSWLIGMLVILVALAFLFRKISFKELLDWLKQFSVS